MVGQGVMQAISLEMDGISRSGGIFLYTLILSHRLLACRSIELLSTHCAHNLDSNESNEAPNQNRPQYRLRASCRRSTTRFNNICISTTSIQWMVMNSTETLRWSFLSFSFAFLTCLLACCILLQLARSILSFDPRFSHETINYWSKHVIHFFDSLEIVSRLSLKDIKFLLRT